MNNLKRIFSILLISAVITCSVSIPIFSEAKAEGFVNDVEITLSRRGQRISCRTDFQSSDRLWTMRLAMTVTHCYEHWASIRSSSLTEA